MRGGLLLAEQLAEEAAGVAEEATQLAPGASSTHPPYCWVSDPRAARKRPAPMLPASPSASDSPRDARPPRARAARAPRREAARAASAEMRSSADEDRHPAPSSSSARDCESAVCVASMRSRRWPGGPRRRRGGTRARRPARADLVELARPRGEGCRALALRLARRGLRARRRRLDRADGLAVVHEPGRGRCPGDERHQQHHHDHPGHGASRRSAPWISSRRRRTSSRVESCVIARRSSSARRASGPRPAAPRRTSERARATAERPPAA